MHKQINYMIAQFPDFAQAFILKVTGLSKCYAPVPPCSLLLV
jgi:hypothetical protein